MEASAQEQTTGPGLGLPKSQLINLRRGTFLTLLRSSEGFGS